MLLVLKTCDGFARVRCLIVHVQDTAFAVACIGKLVSSNHTFVKDVSYSHLRVKKTFRMLDVRL
jgi:hypothetical protein